ncbi:threonine/serine exporter family protein [Nocardioides sp. TRM66260-LWL]|uniref:threonine/serine ThrE exporter family protein n=1 Tax=Nocardioides sp. TRM66260-LWL TaxID=2874478 RepID=UPI001CC66517|nr:threonine/serine exporter family protein [Nocardioides sp. TRM66260-LWL]MBZ5734445.1 threonine/serine exporter family protein [Nocardioides sp. TRM66260-LWL]
MLEPKEVNLTIDLCLRIGEVLLSSGAGAADVTASMQVVARHLGLRNPDLDVTFTHLSMSWQASPEDQPVTHSRLITRREIDYADLTAVDHLVRDLLADRVDLREARARLARLVSSGHRTPRWQVTIAWGVMSAGVATQLGGAPLVVLLAFVAAIAIDRLQQLMARRRLPAFYRQVAGGAIATVIAVAAAAAHLPVDTSLVVTANIVMLLAGVGFMGAIQDALTGFYVTAGARITEALLATAGIIAGISGGLSVARVVGVDVGRFDPAAVGLKSLGLMAFGGAVCAAAFGFATYAPHRALAPIGLVAATAMVISQSIAAQRVGGPWSVALAALVVGMVSWSVSGRLRVPPLVIVVPAVVPLLPGLSIYRGLALLSDDAAIPSEGLLEMVTAASIAIALASGVILGEYIAQPLKREARRLESRLAGPRLVGPLRGPRRRPRRTGRPDLPGSSAGEVREASEPG